MKYIRSFLVLVMLSSCHHSETAVPQKVPSGYLYKVDPAVPGQTAYVCGERPFNANGDLVGADDLSAQTRQIFENLKTSLATVNMTLQDVNQITYSIKDVASPNQVTAANAQLLTSISATYFTTPPKIIDMKAVTQTVRDDVLIEIEVITIK